MSRYSTILLQNIFGIDNDVTMTNSGLPSQGVDTQRLNIGIVAENRTLTIMPLLSYDDAEAWAFVTVIKCRLIISSTKFGKTGFKTPLKQKVMCSWRLSRDYDPFSLITVVHKNSAARNITLPYLSTHV